MGEGGDVEGGEVGVGGDGDGGERGRAGEEEELAVAVSVGPALAEVEEGEGHGEDGGELKEPRCRPRHVAAGDPLHCFSGDGEDGGGEGMELGPCPDLYGRTNWCGP